MVIAMPVPGKVPLHLEGRTLPDREDNVGLVIREIVSRRTLAYLPAVAARSRELEPMLQETDCILFDGTFWSSDELIALELDRRRAENMAHWPLGGPMGSLQMLSKGAGRFSHPHPHQQHESYPQRGLCAADRAHGESPAGRMEVLFVTPDYYSDFPRIAWTDGDDDTSLLLLIGRRRLAMRLEACPACISTPLQSGHCVRYGRTRRPFSGFAAKDGCRCHAGHVIDNPWISEAVDAKRSILPAIRPQPIRSRQRGSKRKG